MAQCGPRGGLNQYGLTDKQEKFCHAYVLNGGHGTDAVKTAGYDFDELNSHTSTTIASQNLTKRNILERIDTLRKEFGIRTDITLEEVQEGYRDVLRRALALKPVTDSEGNEIGVFMQNLAAANKALDGLAKIAGVYSPEKKEITKRRAEPESLDEIKAEILRVLNEPEREAAESI